jgi:hypothetical protein
MYIKSFTGIAAAVLTGVAGFGIPAAGAQGATHTHGEPAKPAHTRPAASCNTDANWPGYVQGEPDGFDAGDDGAYLWHNPTGGWGLRVSHPELPGKANRVVFTGTIVSKGKIGNLAKVRDEKGDVVKVGAKGHVLRFRFVDYGGVDGVDFTTTCTPGLRVALKADRTAMPTQFVHLGDRNTHPGTNPFRIRRRDSDTGTFAVTPGAGRAKKGAPGVGKPARTPPAAA